jgi:NSS family neurotransmitter:Na+ symporter
MGIVLATAGSAVGLGNVWRFPYMTGENGGAVFILVYLFCVLLLGIPCMISEFIIGRHAQTNTARAYRMLSNSKVVSFIGIMSVLTGFLITGYYAVVSGWCLQYIWGALLSRLDGDPAEVQSYFFAFSQHPVKPLFWLIIMMMLTYIIVAKGIRDGIERASKVLMPTLFILLLIIVGASCMLPGAMEGVKFLFRPDWSMINGEVFLSALGQAFYSLSIAMGCICTYASYFSKHTNLASSAVQIGVIDSVVAVLAGLMIFPAAFSVGVSPDSGPSLIFITLPNVFHQAFGSVPVVGYFVSLVFYSLLSLAALTSLMSLVEVSTAFCQEELRISRKAATLMVICSASVIGAFCSLSLGDWEFLSVGSMNLFSLFDFITGQIFLPLGGFFTCLFLGWYVPKQLVKDEFTNWGTLKNRLFGVFLFLIRFVCPIAILAIFLHQLGVF